MLTCLVQTRLRVKGLHAFRYKLDLPSSQYGRCFSLQHDREASMSITESASPQDRSTHDIRPWNSSPAKTELSHSTITTLRSRQRPHLSYCSQRPPSSIAGKQSAYDAVSRPHLLSEG